MVQGNNGRGDVAAGNRGAQNRDGNANVGQGKPIKCYNYNGIGHIARNCNQPKRSQNSDYFKEKMLLMQAQENGVDLDEEQLLFLAGGQTNTFDDDVDEGLVQDMAQNEYNIFQADQCDAFDSDVNEAPTAQTMFMANLSSADLVYDEAGPSYDSDTLSEVQNHDNYLNNMNAYPEEHEMQNDVQPNDVVDSNTVYTSNSNIILYEQYVQDNEEQPAQCVPPTQSNKAVNVSLTAELARYKELAEIVKTTHDRALVHDSEDTLEIAETTRKKMNAKMKDPMCVEKKVKIAPPDYLKENYLAIFTPQKQLTPKQIFWSNDILKEKAKALKEKTKALKEQAKVPKLIIAMTVYPPNTPAKLVPIVLPIKNMLSHRGNPISQTIKEHFEGIQKALINEIKEMKEVFDQMEAEVDQNAVDKKCDEIKRKNLVSENENLIVECLSKDVFYTATDYVLNVSRYSDMHDAYTVLQKGIAELEAENSNLTHKIQKDDHDEMIKHFSKLEVEHLNLAENKKVKQHYKELYDSIKLTRAKTIEKTTSLLAEIKNLKAQIKGKMPCVTMPVKKPKVLTPGMYAIDVEPIPPRNRNIREVYLDYLKHLKESVETLREIVEEARVEKPLDRLLAFASLYTKQYQELLEYVIGTCLKDFNKRDKRIDITPLTRKKQVTFKETCETSTNNTQKHVEQQKIKKTNEPMIPSTGVKDATAASGSKPKRNTKKDRTLPAKSDKQKVEDHPKINKSSVIRKN
ncbi:retrovirus-related pol polyprotein from transposon TNT 1-94 [Tanacetum coccineum]